MRQAARPDLADGWCALAREFRELARVANVGSTEDSCEYLLVVGRKPAR